MAANINPTFPLTPHNESATPATNTNTDGTTGTYTTLFTPGVNGSRLDYVKAQVTATNGSATVLRLFRNTHFFAQRTIPAATVTQTAETTESIIPLDVGLNATSDVITCTVGTAASLKVTAVGGDY